MPACTRTRRDAAGQGFAELSGGRRALLDRATVDLANDGRVTMRFSGESEETLTGRWFVGWGNPVQLAIDGPSEGTAGFGTVHRDPEGRFEVVISGVTSRGQSFRIEFASER